MMAEYSTNIPKKPLDPRAALVLGGRTPAKSIPFLEDVLKRRTFDIVALGGALSYTFLKAQGVKVGVSMVSDNYVPRCRQIMQMARDAGVRILLPVDHIASMKIEPEVTIKMVRRDEEIPDDMMGLDIGIETVRLYSRYLKRARSIGWHGPMGVSEIATFSGGTLEIARSLARSSAMVVVCGDALLANLRKSGYLQRIDHVAEGLDHMRQLVSERMSQL